MTGRPMLIAVDWGTSSCRAYLLGGSGVVLAERRGTAGMLAATAEAIRSGVARADVFERVFDDVCGEFLSSDPALPVIACGMVGASHGWVEAAYREVPADLAAGGEVLTTVRTRAGTAVHIVAGLIVNSSVPDVIRGEETQILGALAHRAPAGTGDLSADQIVVLPGTHSKWVRVSGTTVTDFITCMTGEIFALLMAGSTLVGLAASASSPRWEAFERGLDLAASPVGRAGILWTAFSARALVLTGRLAPEEVSDYLSGLLIGHELTGIAASWLGDEPVGITLCGEAALSDRYRRALERRGVPVARTIDDAAAAGLWQIAVATGLVPATSSATRRASQ